MINQNQNVLEQINQQIDIIQSAVKYMSEINQIITVELKDKIYELLRKEIDVAESTEDRVAVLYAASLATLELSKDENK